MCFASPEEVKIYTSSKNSHMQRSKCTCYYFLTMKHFGICFRTCKPDLSKHEDKTKNKNSIYGDVKEELPEDAPSPLGKPVQLTHYVDANLLHDKLSGKSVSACLHFANGTPIDWYTKKQGTVETATYSSEFVAACTCVEQIIDLCNTLRYLGVRVREKSYMFGDNESVVNSSSILHAKLHKRHNMLSFHRVREAIASKYVDFNYLPGPQNPADILSKHWGYSAVKDVLLSLFHRYGETD